jgi:hypothetical protein
MRSYNGRLSVDERYIAQEMTVLRGRQKLLRERWLLIDIRLSELREKLRASMEARGESFDDHEQTQLQRVRSRKRSAESAYTERFKNKTRNTAKKKRGAKHEKLE